MLRFTALAFLFFLFSPFAPLPVVYGGNMIYVDSDCTFNQAITAANTNATPSGSSCEAGSSSGRDVITLNQNVTLTTWPTNITSTLRIEGNGYSISGADAWNMVSTYAGADAEVNNVILTNGYYSTNGGAVYAYQGKLVITNSVIKDSRTGDHGGAVLVGASNLTIANSAIYNNSTGSDGGGAIVTLPASTTTLIHVTLKGNTTTGANKGGGIRIDGGTVNLRNSIIADSGTGKDCYRVSGTLNIIGSIIKDGSCGQKARDPKLGSLMNGRYFPLQPSSEAIDNGDATYCDDYGYDQAGRARPATNCDSGSVEGPPKGIPSNINVAIDELWNWVVTFDPVAEAGVYQIRYQGLPYDSRGESCQNKYWCEPYNTFTSTRVSVATWGLACVEMQVRAGSGNPQSPYWGAWSHELAVRKPLWDCHGKLLNPTPGQGEDRTKTYQSRYQAVPYSYGQPQAQIAFEPEVQAARLPPGERVSAPWSQSGSQAEGSQGSGAQGQGGHGAQGQQGQGGQGQSQGVQQGQGGYGAQGQGGANPANVGPLSLSNCKVMTTDFVNLRASINGSVLFVLHVHSVWTAVSRDGDWFEIKYSGGTGWVSGDYVVTQGSCG